EVHAEVHAVREIHVQAPGGAEHDLRPVRHAPKGRAGRVVLLVRLALHDASHQRDRRDAANQEPPDQVSRHHERRPGVERPRKGANPYLPGAGCHSSSRLPSGSTAQPNLPYSLSSTWSITSTPAARSCSSIRSRST